MGEVAKKQAVSKTIFGFVAAIFIIIIGMYLYNIVRWKDYPDFGFSLRFATGVNTVGVVREHGLNAGIKAGDIILDVNHKTYTKMEELRNHLNWGIGENNIWHIDRSGRSFYVTIVNIPSGLKRAFTISGLPFLLGLCYALIGTLVFLMKPHQRSSWIFLFYSYTFGIFLVYLSPLGKISPLWLEKINIYAFCFTPAAFIHLAVSFPKERKIWKKYPFVQLFPYLISIIIFLLIWQTAGVMAVASKPLRIAAVCYMSVGVIFFLGSCFQLRITSSSHIVKLRSRMILLGFGISASLPLIDFVANALFNVYLLSNFNYYLPFFVAFPASIGYSIVKHDLFDIDAIIKRTYGYVLTTGALASIYGLIVLISNLAFGRFEITKSQMFPLVFILAVVFLFNPVRNRVQKFIDRQFYRLEYDYQQTVQKISETMRALLKLDEIGKSLMKFALQPLFVDAGAVMLLNPAKSDYVCLVQEGQREDRKVEAGGESQFPEVGLQEKKGRLTADATTEAPEVSCLTLPVDDPLMQKMAERKKEVTIYDIQEDPAFESDREACKKTFDQLGATLLVPLIYEDQLTGVISLGQKKSGKFYRQDDINLLKILANQGAVAIENALMVEDVIEKERMEEELNIARNLQLSMLPAECPKLEGFEIAAYSMAAREVGGDFYDFIDIGENKDGLLIGDVTGKSVSGALVMSSSRSIFRMLSEETLSVGEIMVRANRRIKKDVKSGMFVALLYAVVNAKDKTICFCSAGQTLPIYRSSKKGAASLMDTQGDNFPLGILEDVDYQESILKLESGDKVVFYTDGIVEAMNEKQEIFGFDRLLDVVKKNGGGTSEALLKNILHQIDVFSGGAVQHDDLTIIVLGSM